MTIYPHCYFCNKPYSEPFESDYLVAKLIECHDCGTEYHWSTYEGTKVWRIKIKIKHNLKLIINIIENYAYMIKYDKQSIPSINFNDIYPLLSLTLPQIKNKINNLLVFI